MILQSLHVSKSDFQAATGWELKPQGACSGADVCVPMPAGVAGDEVDVATVADRLGMAVVQHEDAELWAVGPATLTGQALTSAEAPELVLPDADGYEFDLASLRGQKVLIVSWAPY